jgi:hypothetical protein
MVRMVMEPEGMLYNDEQKAIPSDSAMMNDGFFWSIPLVVC